MPLLKRYPYLPLDQVALCCASHTGTDAHQQRVKALLSQAKTGLPALQCGCHPPLDVSTRHQLLKADLSASPLHHNCSGKHAGMLLCCHASGWDQARYLEPDHPLQQEIFSAMADLTGVPTLKTATDGCNAPTFYMPLAALARLYYRLATDDSLTPQRQAMQTYPKLVGGPGRIDTGIMLATQGQLLAKVGADGVMGLCHIPSGTGVALKVWSGDEAVRNRFTLWWINQKGWLPTEQSPLVNAGLTPWLGLTRYNDSKKPIGTFEIIQR